MSAPWDRAAIVGIGQTEFSQASGRSELRLAVEAITAALTEAGLTAADVDGLVTFDADTNDPSTVAATLGMHDLTFFASTLYGGGGGCATVMHAAMAVATGAAEVAVCYRAMNERSGHRYGQAGGGKRAIAPILSYSAPYGIHTAAQGFALNIVRWFHERGITNRDVAPVAVAHRRHAATNPAARFYGRPITIDDHQQSRWIVEPALRLYDCCLESDGAVAVVVTSAARARDLRQTPVRVAGAAQGMNGHPMRNWYLPSIGESSETAAAAKRLWNSAGIGPKDVQAGILYDHFAPMVLTQLEALGLCAVGEAKHFVADGGIEIDGHFPVNTHGGLAGEAYIHGMNGIAEAVRQLRGEAINQVRGVEHMVVTSGPGVPTSALVLGKAP